MSGFPEESLAKRGHEYFIFTTESPGFKDDNDHIIRYGAMIPFKSKGGRYPISWPQIARIQAKKIKKYNLDIIHSQHLLGLGLLGLKVGKTLKIPTILTYHTLIAEYGHYSPLFPGLVRKYLIKKSRDYCNKYNQIITPSNPMADLLREYGVTQPIEDIPTPVEIGDFQNPFTRAELKSKFQIPEGKQLEAAKSLIKNDIHRDAQDLEVWCYQNIDGKGSTFPFWSDK